MQVVGKSGLAATVLAAAIILMMTLLAGDALAEPSRAQVIAAAMQGEQQADDGRDSNQPDADPQATPETDSVPSAPGDETPRSRFGFWDGVLLVLAAASLSLIVLARWHRLRRAPRRSEAMSAITAFALLCAMIVLGRLGLMIGAAVLGIHAPDPATGATMTVRDAALLNLFAAGAQALVLPAFLALHRAARTPSPDMRFPQSRTIAVSVAALLLVWPLVVASGALAGWLIGAPDERIAHDTLRELASGPLDRWKMILAIVAVLAAPVLEEVMYRGLLQEALIRAGLKRWPAIAVASVIFALAHIGAVAPHALPALFVLSLGLGWAYEKTGRLGAPILMHALFNAGNLLVARTM